MNIDKKLFQQRNYGFSKGKLCEHTDAKAEKFSGKRV